MAFKVTLYEQVALFVYALIVGAVIGLIYDIFRISRVMMTGAGIGGEKNSSKRLDSITERLRGRQSAKRVNKLKDAIVSITVFFEDILFCLIATIIFIIFLYHANYGQTRLYLFISAAAGFFAYYNTVGRLTSRMSGIMVSLIRLILAFVLHKAIKPLIRAVVKTVSVPYNSIKLRRIYYLCDMEMKKISAMSKCGFR